MLHKDLDPKPRFTEVETKPEEVQLCSPIITVSTIECPSMNLHCVSVNTQKKLFLFSVSNNDVALKGSLRACLLLKKGKVTEQNP
ncbi:hypothetical protein F7725_006540 [Dissostichus mawsoni]|uniref:Uncharacterized protein n=1 Tax=Dissostichus mawsoni TaxID=36200 RepID=A0A7J5XX13_DISMA|nr:hypothetical protein F7725_006540 [Dissostichus mawsoni]